MSQKFLFKFIQIENYKGTDDEFLKNGFDEILKIITVGLNNEDLIGIKITVPTMPEKGDIGLSFRKVLELSSEIILDLIAMVSQSNSSFKIVNLIEISPTIIKVQTGGRHIINYMSYI